MVVPEAQCLTGSDCPLREGPMGRLVYPRQQQPSGSFPNPGASSTSSVGNLVGVLKSSPGVMPRMELRCHNQERGLQQAAQSPRTSAANP